jgi:hypothetical protein
MYEIKIYIIDANKNILLNYIFLIVLNMGDNYNRSNYINIGNIKDNILRLKQTNHEKTKEKVNKYYKYIEPPKDKEIEIPDSNHFKTLSRFFKIIGGKSTMMSTQTKSNPLLTSNYKTNDTWMRDSKTSMRRSGNLLIQTDLNADQLFQLYDVYDEKKNLSLLNENEKDALLKTFHIDKSLSKHEQFHINKTFGNKTKNSLNNFNKTQIGASTYYFENAEKALNKLKMNKMIYNNMMSCRTTKQYHRFTDKFDQEYERFMKVAQMPKIREKRENHIVESTEVNGSIEVRSNARTLSRAQIFESFLEFQMIYINENFTNRPSSRCMFSLNIIGGYLYLFGGMGNVKLNDIWKCEIRSNILIIQKITYGVE